MSNYIIEDCLKHVKSRFSLIILAASESRRILLEENFQSKYKEKPTIFVLRKISSGEIKEDNTYI